MTQPIPIHCDTCDEVMDAVKDAIIAIYKGKNYYFCDEECFQQFVNQVEDDYV